MPLKGKKIVLCVTGSIAAYKAVYLLRGLVKAGAEVQVLMTEAAREFVTPLTFSSLSGKPVLSDFFSKESGSWNSHVDLGGWADLFVVAPATATTIAKMAIGLCDNLVTTTYLSAKCPVMIAPAMDLDMFGHPALQENLGKLRALGHFIVEPASGELASGLVGKGRMEEPEIILKTIEIFFSEKKKLLNKTYLVTAGPTYEKIDPVRFIGNYSTGKMGFALAEQLASVGAFVILVCGPVHIQTQHPAIQRIDVTSADQMYEVCLRCFDRCNGAILTAAVADYAPLVAETEKIKRTAGNRFLELRPNRDIAAELGRLKKKGQILIGFALESQNEMDNALAKLESKNLDIIVLNSLREEGAGFGYDTNKITILERSGRVIDFPLKSKKEVAADIINHLMELDQLAND